MQRAFARKVSLSFIVVLLLLTFLSDVFVFQLETSAAESENFTIIALPDTQFYAANINGVGAKIFGNQTKWVANNVESLRIAFVTHEGDIVDDGGSVSQWGIAAQSMRYLDAGNVAWEVLPGNHDFINDPSLVNYNTYFGYGNFSSRSWYGGAYPANTNTNNFAFFSGGNDNYLIFNFQYQPSDAVLSWANSIIAAYPNRRVIVTTHDYMNVDGSRTTEGNHIWNGFVASHADQVFLVLCGHNHGEAKRADVVNGHTVNQLLADYQSRTNGGNGLLRILEFRPAEDKVYVKTFSPYLNSYESDSDSEFSFDYDMTGTTEPVQMSLTVQALGNGVTNSTGTTLHDQFDSVTVLAAPDSGYVLSYWLLNGTNVGTANPYTLSMIANYNLTAVFTPVQVTWWNSSWLYRKPIVLTENSGLSLSDYQVKVIASYVPSKMKTDFSDLRFTDSDKVTLLPYWIESYNASAAVLWVKVPSIPASGAKTIYMYYGNPSAVSAGNGTATFDFFDDFNDGIVNTGKWVTSGTVRETSGYLQVGSYSGSIARQNTALYPLFSRPYVLRSRSLVSTTGFVYAYVGFANSGLTRFALAPHSYRSYYTYNGSTGQYTTNTAGLRSFAVYDIVWTTSSVRYYQNGVLRATHTNSPSVTMGAYLGANSTAYVRCDWILAHKYASVDPSITIGQEEGQGLPVQVSLTVGVNGNGVTNATGTVLYDLFRNVTVTAISDSGYVLSYWLLNGTNAGSANPYTINMTANYNLTAVFTPDQVSLTVEVSGNGVTNATGVQVYPKFSNVTISATPSSGYVFDHWLLNGTVVGSVNPYRTIFSDGFESGDLSGWDSYTGNMSVVSSPVHTGTYALKINSLTGGGASYIEELISAKTELYMRVYVRFGASLIDSQGVFSVGDNTGDTHPTVVANPDNYWSIYNWHTSTIYDSSSSTINSGVWYCVEIYVKIGSSGQLSLWIDGTLKLDETVDVGDIGNPIVWVYCENSLPSGTSVDSYQDCVVVADAYIGPETTGGTNFTLNPYTINMTANYNLTAVFVPVVPGQVSLTVGVTGNGVTNATGVQLYPKFTNVTVSATPNSGYILSYWLLNGTNVGSANPYKVNMTNNFILTAVFVPIQETLLDSFSETNRDDQLALGYLGIFAGAQTFTTPNNGVNYKLSSFKFLLAKTGSPTGTVVAKLYAITGTYGSTAVPTGSVLATSTTSLSISTITTSWALYTFTFDQTYQLTANTHYAMVLEASGSLGNQNFVGIGGDTSSPSHSGNAAYYISSWTGADFADNCFYVYGVA